MAQSESDTSDNDAQWEEVALEPEQHGTSLTPTTLTVAGSGPHSVDGTDSSGTATAAMDDDWRLTISTTAGRGKKKSRAQLDAEKQERLLRQALHKAHVLCWLAHGYIVNRRCDDEILQATIMSLAPSGLLVTPGASVGDTTDVLQVFVAMMQRIIDWWRGVVTVLYDDQDFSQRESLNRKLAAYNRGEQIPLCPVDAVVFFIALLRASGLEARLVVSLQAMSFRANAASSSSASSSRRASRKVDGNTSSSPKQSPPPQTSPSQQLSSPPARRSRRTVVVSSRREQSEGVDSTSNNHEAHSRARNEKQNKSSSTKAEDTQKHLQQTLWAEVLLPQEQRWICVDPLRGLVNEPIPPPATKKLNHQLQHSYVVAWEAVSGHIKDVTRRYVLQYNQRVRKQLRLEPWWSDEVVARLATLTAPSNAEADRRENEELYDKCLNEGIPTTVSALLNHPLYVLERHLKKFEYLHPRRAEDAVGQLRGGELIFKRSLVHLLHTADKWLSMECRVVRPGEMPVKLVKSRAINTGNAASSPASKRRKICDDDDDDDDDDFSGSAMTSDGGKRDTVGLFGEWQTEPYTPAPIIKGIIPKNKYQNMDLFQPAMLPPGAVHLVDAELLRAAGLQHTLEEIVSRSGGGRRLPTLKKVCRAIPVDFAEAVVGFDYHGGRSVPRTVGVVIAEENEEMVTREYISQLLECLEKEVAAREKMAVARWERLAKKLIMRRRLFEKFGHK